jgi:hypothetical protein
MWSVYPTTDSSRFCQSAPTTKPTLKNRKGRQGRWFIVGTGADGRAHDLKSDSGARFSIKRAGFRSSNARLTSQLEQGIYITILT